MYYLKKDDSIVAFSVDKFNENCLYTDENIVVTDTGVYFESQVPDSWKATCLRKERNKLLKDTDIYMLSDYPLSDDEKEQIKAYRQALRDLPEQNGFPTNCQFPEKPDFLQY